MAPQRLVVFDTSVYVPYYRGEAYREFIRSETLRGRTRLYSVVLQELYAGTRSLRHKRELDIVEQAFHRRGYLLTPAHQDWVAAGQAISYYMRSYGALDPRDHINDLLIFLCAAQVEARIVTENASHFEMWDRPLHRTGLKLEVEEMRREDHLN